MGERYDSHWDQIRDNDRTMDSCDPSELHPRAETFHIEREEQERRERQDEYEPRRQKETKKININGMEMNLNQIKAEIKELQEQIDFIEAQEKIEKRIK